MNSDILTAINSTENESPLYAGPHVEYVLAAEFDIDSGPVVKFQYPSFIKGDQQYVFPVFAWLSC